MVFITARIASIFVSSTAVHMHDFHIVIVMYNQKLFRFCAQGSVKLRLLDVADIEINRCSMQAIIGLLFTHSIVDSNCLNVPTVLLGEKELNIVTLMSLNTLRL